MNSDESIYELEPVRMVDIFPYKVYLETGLPVPDGEGTLKLLEAGFLDLENAEFYVKHKSGVTGNNYVIISSVQNESV